VNIENLTTLANFLDTLPAPAFHMGSFARDEHGERLDIQIHECATVACAVGYGPRAGIHHENDRSWEDYSERVFEIEIGSRSWMWCFAGTWADVDNTPSGAAKRIRYLITHGEPPSNSFSQRQGSALYMFAEAA